ncbi:LysM domain-containing GPI-anchored protein 2 [Linum perenne]
MDRHNPLFLHLLILLPTISSFSGAAAFKCTTTPAKCHSLIDYITPPHDTTFAAVQSLFEIRNLRMLLGANNLPLSTSPNDTLTAKQTLKIPFPCLCHGRKGVGVSNKRPMYKVTKRDKDLDAIAAKVFAGVVTGGDIAAVNDVSEKVKVHVGMKLWIPLPCSCDDVEGNKVVHYGHVAEAGSSLEGIAATYGASVDVLKELNGLKDGSGLSPGQVLDVPIRACNSSIRDDSVDSKFLVANGTYAFTAHNCVKCSCDSSNNWTLHCYASGVKPSDWSTCPATQCGGKTTVPLGNSTSSVCGGATCSYAGFSSNITIFTTFPRTCSSNGIGGRIGPQYLNLGFLWMAHLLLHQLWLSP